MLASIGRQYNSRLRAVTTTEKAICRRPFWPFRRLSPALRRRLLHATPTPT